MICTATLPLVLLNVMANAAMVDAVSAKCGLDDGGLAELWRVTKVHELLQKKFKEEGVETLPEFATYFTYADYEVETTTFRDKEVTLRDRQVEVARLRMAYTVATKVGENSLEKKVKATVLDIEGPLEDANKLEILEAWKQYHIKLTMYFDPGDPLVNRLFREFRAEPPTPSLVLAEKVRSTFQCNTPAIEQKHPLPGSNIAITVEEAPDVDIRDVYTYYIALRILANAYAKAGNILVDSQTDKGEKVVYVRTAGHKRGLRRPRAQMHYPQGWRAAGHGPVDAGERSVHSWHHGEPDAQRPISRRGDDAGAR